MPEDWSASGGPDTFTLRAWLGVERAAEALEGLDDSVNFMQDRASTIFGPSVFSRFPQFLEQHDLGEDPLGRLLADDEAPDGDDGFVWLADPPGSRAERFRRAVRRRRETALRAQVLPRAGRVAGSRARERRELLGPE